MQFTSPRDFNELTCYRIVEDGSYYLFRSYSRPNEMRWHGGNLGNFKPPTAFEIDQYVTTLAKDYGKSSHEDLANLFEDWPCNVLEEWVVDYHDSFRLKFDAFYQAQAMETIITVSCYGFTNIDYNLYYDSFKQATTLRKLGSNL